MTDDTPPSAKSKPGPNKGVKQGLPTLGLQQAEESAKKLWEVARAAETTKQILADRTGHSSITSSAFKARLAVLRGFGIVTVTGANVKLTQLGLDLVQDYDEEKRCAGRIKAINTLKAYRDLVEAFQGTRLPEKASLSSRLKFEYGKTDDFAGQAAGAFIESLEFAGMLDAVGLVQMNGAVAKDENCGSLPTDQEASAEDEDVAVELEEAFSDDDVEPDASASIHINASQAPAHIAQQGAGSATSLTVTLDLSQFEANEVLRILRALGLAKGE